MGITVLFVDEKSTLINGFIPVSLVDQFRSSLTEGDIYTLKAFEINRCQSKYKITDHPYMIRFLPSTTITKTEGYDSQIVKHKFMLRNLDELKNSADTNLELPDVVGLVRFVQGANIEDASSTKRLVVRLQISLSQTVNLTLWDEAAATFRSHVASQKTKQSVMIVTTVNPKIFNGDLYLNSTAGTRFYFDKDIDEVQNFSKSLATENGMSFKCVDTSGAIKKKEQLTIKELHTYICNLNEQTQDADFICEATVTQIPENNEWSYVSCAKCSRKLEKYGTELRCNRCVSGKVTGVVRVELNVQDDTDAATFVGFDSPMTSLLSKTAGSLILECGEECDPQKLPNCLLGLIGKRFRFHVKVAPYNFTPKHRSFTVSSVTAIDTSKVETTAIETSEVETNEHVKQLSPNDMVSDGVAKNESRKRRRA